MALRVALDTNWYSDLAKGIQTAVAPVSLAREIYMPFCVLAELRSGFLHGARRQRNERALNEFFKSNRVSALFADEATTHIYAQVFDELRRNGTPIPINDIWLAAIVIQHDLVLLTRDPHFELVSGVTCI